MSKEKKIIKSESVERTNDSDETSYYQYVKSQKEEESKDDKNETKKGATFTYKDLLKEYKGFLIKIGIAIIIFIVLVIVSKTLDKTKNEGTKVGSTIRQNTKLKIYNTYTNALIKVNSVEKNYLASNGEGTQKFTRINITIQNIGKVDYSSEFNVFFTVDKDGVATGDACYDRVLGYGLYPDYMFDAITTIISPGDIASGYIYCQDPSAAAKKLEVSSVTKIDEENINDNILIPLEYDKYYIKLK